MRHAGDALPWFSIALEPGGPPSAPGYPNSDNVYEHGGFAAHSFDEALLKNLAQGSRVHRVDAFEEGERPR